MEDGDRQTKKAKAGSFQSLGLSPNVLKGILRMGYKIPTPIQRKSLPYALQGQDLVCMARTGSGKTCAFLVPLLERLKEHQNRGVRAVILAPTRELALQTKTFLNKMGKFVTLRCACLVGGDALEDQFEELAKNPDVLVATPGRLMHLLREIDTFNLRNVEYLVFDEADRLFEMGFAEQLNEIMREMPEQRQTLLFSATMPKLLIQFARAGLKDPQLIRLDTDTKISEQLRLAFLSVRSNEKAQALLYLVKNIIPDGQSTIVFAATKHHVEYLHELMKQSGYDSVYIYGDMDQEARQHALQRFRKGHVNYLLVTDVAARGIDVPLLNNVINYSFPPTPKLFVHRCGRAARAGRIGFAFSLVDPDELPYMLQVYTFLGRKVRDLYIPAEFNREGKPLWEDASTAATSSAPSTSGRQARRPSTTSEAAFEEEEEEDDNDDDQDEENDEHGDEDAEGGDEDAGQEAGEKSSDVDFDGEADDTQCLDDLEREADKREANNGADLLDEQIEELRRSTTRYGYTLNEMMPEMVHYGTLPQDALDEETTHLTHLLHNDVAGLATLARLCDNAMKQYRRTRPDATKSAAAAAKHVSTAEIHPLILGMDKRKVHRGVVEKANLVQHLRSFRPQQTVFEAKAIASGKAKDLHGAEVMEAFRREVRSSLQRNKKPDPAEERHAAADDGHDDEQPQRTAEAQTAPVELEPTKKRLSKAQRKKLKQQGITAEQLGKIQLPDTADAPKKKVSATKDFKDQAHYISYGTEEESFVEAALQPRAGERNSEKLGADLLESAYLDITPDEALEMSKKKRILHWDAKKRKYVRTTLKDLAEQRGAKKIRTESGVKISASSANVGEMYAKWKKKTRIEIGVQNGDEYRERPRVSVNKDVKDELRDAAQIRKLRKQKERLAEKNKPKKGPKAGGKGGNKAGASKKRKL